MERKLAAILAADVAGYSRPMEADEEGTLAALRRHREVVDALIAAHRGRVFNSAGDSVIAEFASAVEATLCAVAIQQTLAQRNATVPKGERLEFRIGLNIGDVMVDGANLFGDGVNVADRVQKLAEPGGICVARNVHDHLRNKAELAFEPMGEHQVKNISVPVSVYRVLVPGAARRPLAQRWLAVIQRRRRIATTVAVLLVIVIGGLAAWPLLNPPAPRGFPKLAVLPFEDLSGGAAPAHYGDGISEDLITVLSRFPDITVVSDTSGFAGKGPEISVVSPDKSFTFNGKDTDAAEAGRALGVDYVLEGKVQKKGDGLRINVKLIDTETNVPVWTGAYEGGDPTALQDSSVTNIAAVLAREDTEIRNNEYNRTKGVADDDLDEYGFYLRATEIQFRADSIEAHDRIAPLLEKGLKKFPES
ncbi:MAG TPA: adenylate/guanylate cyclase domain-containing protein, partial [Dongiaceae bacterium]